MNAVQLGSRALWQRGALLGTGNGEMAWLTALPILNAEDPGVMGRITSDSGGTTAGEIVAICLK